MEVLMISLIVIVLGAVGWFSAPAEMIAHFGFAIVLALVAIATAINTK